jgi:hypothetical protein
MSHSLSIYGEEINDEKRTRDARERDSINKGNKATDWTNPTTS